MNEVQCYKFIESGGFASLIHNEANRKKTQVVNVAINGINNVVTIGNENIIKGQISN